jgi:hypothetical protein
MIKFTFIMHHVAARKKPTLGGVQCFIYCRYRRLSHKLTANWHVKNVLMILTVLTLHLSKVEQHFDALSIKVS